MTSSGDRNVRQDRSDGRRYDRTVIVDCAAYRDGRRATGTLPIEEIGDWIGRPDTFVWIGLRIPERAELQAAIDACRAQVHDVAELLAPHERPTFAVEDGSTTLVLRTAHMNTTLGSVMLGELTVLVGTDHVISVRHGQASPLTATRAHLEAHPDEMRLGPPAVLAAITEQVIADYGPVLDVLERASIDIEREVLDDSGRHPVKQLYRLKRELREFSTATDALDDPMERLIRSRRDRWPAPVLHRLEEANDLLDRGSRRAASLSNLLDSAFDTAMAEISNQQNEDMRKISAWVAIAAVPTMIAGIYGMNFRNLPELDWEYGYFVVIGFMALICSWLYRRFRKAGWL